MSIKRQTHPMPEGEPGNRVIEITMDFCEAMETLQALHRHYESPIGRHHDVGRPRVRELIIALRSALEEADSSLSDILPRVPQVRPDAPGVIIREIHHHHYHAPRYPDRPC